jgi:hypothetical protein
MPSLVFEARSERVTAQKRLGGMDTAIIPPREERLKKPDEYFCVGYSDKPADYFWGDLKVSKEEYLEARPKDACD